MMCGTVKWFSLRTSAPKYYWLSSSFEGLRVFGAVVHGPPGEDEERERVWDELIFRPV